LIAFILGFACLSLSGQPDFKRDLNIGFSQGVAISRVSFDPAVDQELFTGYTGGLILRYITEPQLGIQIEANYLQRGWIEETDSSGRYKRSQEVLTFPLMTHFYAGKQTKARLQFVLGPYLAYLLSDSEKNGVNDINIYRDYYGISPTGKIEFGYSAGISVALRTKIGILELDMRYNHALTNLFKPGEKEIEYQGSRPQTVVFGFHYLVSFKSRE